MKLLPLFVAGLASACSLSAQTYVQSFESLSAGTTTSGLPAPFYTGATYAYAGWQFASDATVVTSPALAGSNSLALPGSGAGRTIAFGVDINPGAQYLSISVLVRSDDSAALGDAAITFANTASPLLATNNVSVVSFAATGGGTRYFDAGVGSTSNTGVTWSSGATYQVNLQVDFAQMKQTLSILDSGGASLWSSAPTTISNIGTNDYAVYLGTYSSAGSSAYYDNVSYTTTAVPEPSTYAALAGVIALGFVGWRRRRSA